MYHIHLALALLLLALPFGPASAACPPIELLYDEYEQIAQKRSDTNSDCQHDEVVHYVDGIAQRAERDTDHDGGFDVWQYYEEDGRTLARQDEDSDGDGAADRWVTFRQGLPSLQIADRNGDGDPDSSLRYREGEPESLEEDSNFDGRSDRFTRYLEGQVAAVESDGDFDGRLDVRAEFGAEGEDAALKTVARRVEADDVASLGLRDEGEVLVRAGVAQVETVPRRARALVAVAEHVDRRVRGRPPVERVDVDVEVPVLAGLGVHRHEHVRAALGASRARGDLPRGVGVGAGVDVELQALRAGGEDEHRRVDPAHVAQLAGEPGCAVRDAPVVLHPELQR